MEKVLNYLEENKEKLLDDLKEFIKIKSISAEPEYKDEVLRAKDFLVERLNNFDFEVEEYVKKGGHPLILAQKIIDPALPTVLIYGHYDVQPVDPIEAWDNDPFDPVEKDGKIYARGASDDKGQLWVYMSVLQAYHATQTQYPVNIKVIIEGEEESNGETIAEYIKNNKEKLACDILLLSDSTMYEKGWPAICTSTRGIYAATLELTTARTDSHSGIYGGLVANPVYELAKIITALKDDDCKITIPGFYDDVELVSDAYKANIESLNFSTENFLGEIGVTTPSGEAGFSDVERLWRRPTVEVNGLWGGYNKLDGFKTVLPNKAYAKISMRLVANQDPAKIAKAFEEKLQSLCPATATLDIRCEATARAWMVDSDNDLFTDIAGLLGEEFGKKAVFIGTGGSILVLIDFQDALNPQTVLIGFGLDSDQIHAPNEHFHIENFYKGIKAITKVLEYIGKR